MSKRDREKRPGAVPAGTKKTPVSAPAEAASQVPSAPAPGKSTVVVAAKIPAPAAATSATKPAASAAKSAATPAKPAATAAKPAATAAKPAATPAKPAVSAAKPTAVAAKPVASAAKPGPTVAKPAVTSAKPAAASARPATPAEKRESPATKPALPGRPASLPSAASGALRSGATNGLHPGALAHPAAPKLSTTNTSLQPDARDPSDALTMAPPAKRQRASQPREPLPTITGSQARERASASDEAEPAHKPFTGDNHAAAAEPPLEVAASIAVASDRADSAAAARLSRSSSGDRLREAAAFGTSQSLLSTDYYFRQYGAHGVRSMVAEVDDFGFDPHVDNKVKPLLEALCRRYFRVELVGAEHIPSSGRALLVANRAGALPWDGLVLRTALRAQRPELSSLRWLAEDSVIHYPFMGVFMNRLGAVRACPENAERLLAQNRLVAVFPEGAQGSRKLFRDRYRLQRFGRGGYVKLALKLGVPIFPTAIIGAEEINPVLGRSRLLGRILGSDSVPLTPTFPWLGLAGLLPAPVRWRIAVGPPIDLSSYGPEAADDALIVHRLNEQIRSSLQALVDQGKSARGNALFG